MPNRTRPDFSSPPHSVFTQKQKIAGAPHIARLTMSELLAAGLLTAATALMALVGLAVLFVDPRAR